jgi:small conductance mechanosensitive channel
MKPLIDRIFYSLLDLVDSAVKLVPGLIAGLIIIGFTGYLAKLTENVITKFSRRAIKNRSLQLLLIKTSYIGAWVFGILLASIVAFPGLKLGDIIATLGLGSVAIGFAFQDIFKNFLAGILLLLQEPFKIGDQIIIDQNYEGTVENIDIRSTCIRTYQGELVLVPNALVFTSSVQVRTAFEHRRTDLAVGVDYNTSLIDAKEILQHTIENVPGVLAEPNPIIDVIGFGDSSIDFVVKYWTTPQGKTVAQTKTQVIIAIKKALDQANITIPYPIRTLYFYNQLEFREQELKSLDTKI